MATRKLMALMLMTAALLGTALPAIASPASAELTMIAEAAKVDHSLSCHDADAPPDGGQRCRAFKITCSAILPVGDADKMNGIFGRKFLTAKYIWYSASGNPSWIEQEFYAHIVNTRSGLKVEDVGWNDLEMDKGRCK
jgi:hypothetical protein